MAQTQFGINDPRTQKIWSEKVFRWLLANSYLTQGGLMGNSDAFPIQIDTSLVDVPGDKVTFKLRAPLTGTGVGDDGVVLNDAEALAILNFTLEVHERAHSVYSNGLMSEKRTDTDIRTEAKIALGDWFAEVLEQDAYQALAGLYNVSAAIQTVNVKAPTTNRIWHNGQTTGGVINAAGPFATDALLSAQTASNCLMGTNVLSLIRRKMAAGTSSYPKIRPIMVKGDPYYVALLHPLQLKSIRQEVGDGQWRQIQAMANMRGSDNPLFTGAAGVWDGVILKEYDRPWMLRTGAGGTTPAEGFTLAAGLATTSDPVANGVTLARALFMGAQAGCVGWGLKPMWTEDKLDVKRKAIVANSAIYGVSKTQFNTYSSGSMNDSTVAGTNTAGEDFGVFVVDTAVQLDL